MSPKHFFAVTAILCVAPLLAQDAPPANGNPAPARPAHRGGGAPCWQQAGVQKSAIEELRSIQRETHSQIESVCSNSSFTPQEKHKQVQEIREQAHQKIDGLITPGQMKALAACRQARGEPTPSVLSGANGAGGGGCGEWQHRPSQPGNNAPGTGNKPANSPANQPSSQN